MIFSANILKWAMRFYPPLFFQRIWVQRLDSDCTGLEVKIIKSFLNTNHNSTIFGGTIFAASDPFYALMFDQIFKKKGFKTRIWLKSATINYVKPGRSNLYFRIKLSAEQIQEAEQALNTVGKFVKIYPIEIVNREGELCASVMNEVYIRNLNKSKEEVPSMGY